MSQKKNFENLLFTKITGRKFNSSDLANFLMQAMETRFSTIIEDDSDLEVAELICEMYNQCSKGDYSLVEKVSIYEQFSIQIYVYFVILIEFFFFYR